MNLASKDRVKRIMKKRMEVMPKRIWRPESILTGTLGYLGQE